MSFRTLRLLAALSALLASVAGAQEEGPRAEVAAIEAAAPPAWHAARVEQGTIPSGHHWGERYGGPRGTLLVLVGPTDVFLNWSERGGPWHREALAKESLHIWVMPPSYRDSFWSFLNIHRPAQPELVFKGERSRVYARASHEAVDTPRLQELLGQYATAWPDSPHETGALSWRTWRQDLTLALEQLAHP